MSQTRKYRCTYSFPCGKWDRHCYEIVLLGTPDVPGYCNDDCDGEDPDWQPEEGPLFQGPLTREQDKGREAFWAEYKKALGKIWGTV